VIAVWALVEECKSKLVESDFPRRERDRVSKDVGEAKQAKSDSPRKGTIEKGSSALPPLNRRAMQ
jgi:hypothetical protein